MAEDLSRRVMMLLPGEDSISTKDLALRMGICPSCEWDWELDCYVPIKASKVG